MLISHVQLYVSLIIRQILSYLMLAPELSCIFLKPLFGRRLWRIIFLAYTNEVTFEVLHKKKQQQTLYKILNISIEFITTGEKKKVLTNACSCQF